MQSPAYYLAIGLLAGIAGFRIGWRFPGRIALPLTQGLAGWGAFLLAWRFVGLPWAAATAGAWALGTSAIAIYTFEGLPVTTDERVFRSTRYRGSMVAWLRGGGSLADPVGKTAWSHLHELILYGAGAALTGNLVSLVMGAALLNMMNGYVAALWRASRTPRAIALYGWPPWSLVRVAAYLALGAAAAVPFADRLGWTLPPRGAAGLAAAGAAGVVLDFVLKVVLSRRWGRALAAAVDLDALAAGREVPRTMAIKFD